ncbi:uncharacterized protein LOC123722494 [Papilio machaon]|uniref:uncharacterized protein LOC123722494 n=1 Tax=Papilio machaon TaxID=76193 RepID=UPI001E665AAD|nr:uncharacterized protein LOC123722494 [Papilio machaon]
MVLLCPTIGGLRKLISICERYAEKNDLRYNAKKSEVMVFTVGSKCLGNIPPVFLDGSPLKLVDKFKYLGHWVTFNLNDDLDIERERRALSVRCNMLARRFARCTREVKTTLFRAFCQSFYTCSLWASFTQRAYSALRVQYNNGLRAMLGLPRFCSASAMFAEAKVNDFYAIMRYRSASLISRIQASNNSLLIVLASRWDSAVVRNFNYLHCNSHL